MNPWMLDDDGAMFHGDCLDAIRDGLDYDAIVTSPPYLDARGEYGHPDGQWWDDFFAAAHGPALINVGRLWRDGCESDWWLHITGYAKANGWKHRDTLVWIKPNANPIHGQVFANSHEYVLLLDNGDSELNTDAIRTPYEPESVARFNRKYLNGGGVKGEQRPADGRAANDLGARARSFFVAYVGKDKGNPHPAPMPLELADYLVRLATWPGQTVLDPFGGSGTTGVAARRNGRRFMLVDLDEQYLGIAAQRLSQMALGVT